MDTPENVIPSLHVYSPYAQHSEAYLVGTRDALQHLYETLGDVLREKEGIPESQATAHFFANDGEGYALQVTLCETEEIMEAYATPYTWEAAQDEHAQEGNPRYPRKRNR